MRFYDIIVLEKDGQTVFRRYTSFVNGVTVKGALNIEFDLPLASVDVPSSGAMVKVWGIPLGDVTQATDFNGKLIKVYGGMRYGLPLANPKQSALLVQGMIFQCFGNWQGEELSNTFIVQPSLGKEKAPLNLSFSCKKGANLSDSIANVLLQSSVVGATVSMGQGLDKRLVAPEDIFHVVPTVAEFARFIREYTISLVNDPKYNGVYIIAAGDNFIVTDGENTQTAMPINATDLIGQPVFLNAVTVQVKCVLRGDIGLFQTISLPDGFFGKSTASSAGFIRDGISFTGAYTVVKIRHIANFRSSDANSWVTVLDLYAQQVPPPAIIIPQGTPSIAPIGSKAAAAAANANMQAFLSMVRQLESGNRYNVIYGGATFPSYAAHPNIKVPFVNPATGKNDVSTAAGAYQMIFTTWLKAAGRAALTDFTPASQDRAAIELFALHGATDTVMRGDFDSALKIMSVEWASLPYSTAQQHPAGYNAALALYRGFGGQVQV